MEKGKFHDKIQRQTFQMQTEGKSYMSSLSALEKEKQLKTIDFERA